MCVHIVIATRLGAMDGPTEESKVVKLRFCPETNDLLYPKAEENELTYVCQSSEYVERPPKNEWCVYRRVVKHTVKDKSVVLTDVRSDPTLPKETNVTCPNCGANEAVIFCSSSERGMTLFLNCVSCAHRWKEAV
jgi:DNA-directed RNA polymerase II subunit RPB9